MAKLVTGTGAPFRMDQLNIGNLLDGDYTETSSTLVKLDLGDGFLIQFTGSGFAFDSLGNVAGGTIAGIQDSLNGNAFFTVSDINVSATQFAGWAQTSDTDKALTTIFAGDDNMTGNTPDEYINGYAGHDNLFGGAGADTLLGGTGNDHLYGQSANGGTDGGDSLSGGDGSDYLQGNAGNDTLDGGAGSDSINGGANDDQIIGGSGNDTVNGNRGNDTIDGGSDNDSLRGGQDNDSISGGDGNDTLSGDLGVDTLTGGAGSDLFQFSGQGSTVNGGTDRVTDYVDGSDHVSVGYAPAAVLMGEAQASLAAADTAAQQLFDGHGGNAEVAALMVGSDTYLFYSSDGGATADSAILVAGVSASLFTAADFV
ncbi:MAG: calcium-binding protein [Acidobacteria bacterium]|nr:calcium-binding protein [Acidobacteriota bacterium]